MIPAPFDLPLDDFLKGVGSTKDLDIDPVFSIVFEKFWNENKPYITLSLPIEKHPVLQESKVLTSVKYLNTDHGIIAVDLYDNPIGCYLWSALCLDPNWQGLGLGRELVIVRLIRDGANPVWNLDIPAYSPAGLAAHQSAWRSVRGE